MRKIIPAAYPKHAAFSLGTYEIDCRIVARAINFFFGRRKNISSAMKYKHPVTTEQYLFRENSEEVEGSINLNSN